MVGISWTPSKMDPGKVSRIRAAIQQTGDQELLDEMLRAPQTRPPNWCVLGATVRLGAAHSYSRPGPAWWRRRQLNPRPKQLPPGLLRACPGFWFSPGGSSRQDPLPPAAVTVPPQGRGAPG